MLHCFNIVFLIGSILSTKTMHQLLHLNSYVTNFLSTIIFTLWFLIIDKLEGGVIHWMSHRIIISYT